MSGTSQAKEEEEYPAFRINMLTMKSKDLKQRNDWETQDYVVSPIQGLLHTQGAMREYSEKLPRNPGRYLLYTHLI